MKIVSCIIRKPGCCVLQYERETAKLKRAVRADPPRHLATAAATAAQQYIPVRSTVCLYLSPPVCTCVHLTPVCLLHCRSALPLQFPRRLRLWLAGARLGHSCSWRSMAWCIMGGVVSWRSWAGLLVAAAEPVFPDCVTVITDSLSMWIKKLLEQTVLLLWCHSHGDLHKEKKCHSSRPLIWQVTRLKDDFKGMWPTTWHY